MDKYTTQDEKDKPENKGKKIIADDAYAICDFIDQLNNKLEHLRISAIR